MDDNVKVGWDGCQYHGQMGRFLNEIIDEYVSYEGERRFAKSAIAQLVKLAGGNVDVIEPYSSPNVKVMASLPARETVDNSKS